MQETKLLEEKGTMRREDEGEGLQGTIREGHNKGDEGDPSILVIEGDPSLEGIEGDISLLRRVLLLQAWWRGERARS